MSVPKSATELVRRGWTYLNSQRPLAAWAAWQQALRVEPSNPAASEALHLLAESPELPPAARAVYRFRTPSDAARRGRWDEAMRDGNLSELPRAAAVFRALAEADPLDADARFNLGLCFAWLGHNAEAVAQLDESLRLDAGASDPRRFEAAVDAATLAEVLRQGSGAEHLADDLSHTLEIAWPADLGEPIEWLAARVPTRTLPIPTDPVTGESIAPGVRVGEWLDRHVPEPQPGLSVQDIPRVRATLVSRSGGLELSNPRASMLREVEADLHILLGEDLRVIDRRTVPLPIPLLDTAAWQFRLPEGLDEPDRKRLLRECIERYYEQEWIVESRKSLSDRSVGAISEGDAKPSLAEVGRRDSASKALLAGVVRLREQLAGRPQLAPIRGGYPFDRLRRRLGLSLDDPDAVDPDDYSSMGLTDLERLDPASLDPAGLVEATRAARPIAPGVEGGLAAALGDVDLAALLNFDFPDLVVALVARVLSVEGAGSALERLDRLDAVATDDQKARLALLRGMIQIETDDREAAIATFRAVGDLAADLEALIDAAGALAGLNDREGAVRLLGLAERSAARRGDLLLERKARRNLERTGEDQ